MNTGWDTTRLSLQSTNFLSSSLTVKEIEKIKLSENQDGYLIKFEEDIKYRGKNYLDRTDFTVNEIRLFKDTYKNKEEVSIGDLSEKSNAFYYFVYYLGKKEKTIEAISFRGYKWVGGVDGNRIFYLSDADVDKEKNNQPNKDVNSIIQKEKEKWDKIGYTNEKDLISDNKKIVDAKWEALHKDSNGKEWSLSEEEKEKIKNASTIEKVKEIQKEITNKKEQNKIDEERKNALATNPQTGTNWNPELTTDEKDVINNSSLDTPEAIQAAAKLLSYLRSIRNEEKNGGPGELTDWNATEKVNEAIKTFQKTHYDNISPYQTAHQVAKETNDQGKAWKVVNTKLNNLAENIYQRYWQLICNLSQHKKMEQQSEEQEKNIKKLQQELKEKQEKLDKAQEKYEQDERILKAILEVSLLWNKAEMIDRSEEDNVLGAKWREDLAKKATSKEIVTEKDKLIKKIADTEKEEKKKQEEYEKKIQIDIDEAKLFIRRGKTLSASEADNLLKKLKDFRDEYAASPVPAKYRAFLSKNQNNAFNKLITELRLKICKDQSIELINKELKDLNEEKEDNRYPLQTFDLEKKYYNFVNEIYKMDDEEKINKYENEMIILINKLRPFRVDLDKDIKTVKKLLDKDDNSEEAQQSREKVWDFLLNLEKYKNSSESDNRYMWLSYGKKWDEVDPLIDGLLGLIRNQGSARVTKWKNILVSVAEKEKTFIEKEFVAYQRAVRLANSLDLKNQKHEKAFQEKIENHLKQQLQNKPQEEQNLEAKVQQDSSILPKK